MHSSNPWLQLLAYLGKEGVPPFRVVHGMRHQVARGVCCAVHSHRDLEIVYHSEGSGLTRISEAEIRFEQGGVIIYGPGQAHDQVMDRKGEDVCLQLEVPAMLRPSLRGSLYVPPPIDPLVIAELEVLTRNRTWLEPSARAIMHLRATAVLLSLVQTASAQGHRESMQRTERHVAEAESYLRDHFQTIGSLQEAAHHVGISHDRLRHLFQQHRGISLVRFLSNVRLERARSLLLHSRLPIKQVGALSGFRDEYYFSAVFRRFHDFSPRAYREKSERAEASKLCAKNPAQVRRRVSVTGGKSADSGRSGRRTGG